MKKILTSALLAGVLAVGFAPAAATQWSPVPYTYCHTPLGDSFIVRGGIIGARCSTVIYPWGMVRGIVFLAFWGN